jgi:serine/threonine protein kinase
MRRIPLQDGERLTDKYRLLGTIGEGTYGVVLKAESRRANATPFAIKVVKSSKEDRSDILSLSTLRELKLLRELNHPNVIKLHEVDLDPIERNLGFVFEYGT